MENSWLCVWGVRAGGQGQRSSDSSVEADCHMDGRQLGGDMDRVEPLYDITFSVEAPSTICMVDQQSALGGVPPISRMLLEGKAVGIVLAGRILADRFLAGRFLVSESLVTMLSRVMTKSTWQFDLNAKLKRCKPAIAAKLSSDEAGLAWTCPMNSTGTPTFSAAYARTSKTVYCDGHHHTPSYSRSADWRCRFSGAAGGIPPTPNYGCGHLPDAVT